MLRAWVGVVADQLRARLQTCRVDPARSGRALAARMAITAHIERDKPMRATTFVKEIREKTEMLAHSPEIGRPGRAAGTRELIVHENYIVP